jgi:hypothetical protein
MDKWLRLLTAAIEDDYDGCVEWSLKLGYLIGGESDVRIFLHSSSLGENGNASQLSLTFIEFTGHA